MSQFWIFYCKKFRSFSKLFVVLVKYFWQTSIVFRYWIEILDIPSVIVCFMRTCTRYFSQLYFLSSEIHNGQDDLHSQLRSPIIPNSLYHISQLLFSWRWWIYNIVFIHEKKENEGQRRFAYIFMKETVLKLLMEFILLPQANFLIPDVMFGLSINPYCSIIYVVLFSH